MSTDRIMYDSTTTDAIPDDAEMVAYYPVTYPGPVDQFKNASIVTIDNQGDRPDFAVLDVESGAASVADAPKWLDDKLANHGGHGTLYCNQNTLPVMLKAIGERKAYLWIANPTGEEHSWSGDLPANITLIGTQYAWPGLGSPGHYDMSLITDAKWEAKPAPEPAPDPEPTETTKGVLVLADLSTKNLETSDGKTWTEQATS